MLSWRALGCAIACVLSWSVDAHADPPPMRLDEAIAFAVAHHPSLQTSQATERLAQARTDAARIDELPRAGVTAQINRATGNVVPGSLFPMTGIPTVAGPPTGRTFDSGAWGSALGAWAEWDVTDLLHRMTLVDASLAEGRQAQAATAARRLQVAYDAADAFVGVLDAIEAVHAMQANVERARVFSTVVHTLVTQQLRPGADAARADAELALAVTLLTRAEQSEAVRHARLAEALGIAGQPVQIVAGNWPHATSTNAAPTRHPLLLEEDAAVEAARIRERAVGLEYLPRVDLVASVWLRGSGYFPGGASLGAAQGLLPDTPNWAAGVVMSWPVMELFATRARVRIANADVAVRDAHRREVEQALIAQIDAARAILQGAQRVAANTQPALDAARAAEQQARSRYQAGLATALEVADAQRLLAQADLDAVVARIEVGRAMLLVARATGDLTPFLVETQRAAPEGH